MQAGGTAINPQLKCKEEIYSWGENLIQWSHESCKAQPMARESPSCCSVCFIKGYSQLQDQKSSFSVLPFNPIPPSSLANVNWESFQLCWDPQFGIFGLLSPNPGRMSRVWCLKESQSEMKAFLCSPLCIFSGGIDHRRDGRDAILWWPWPTASNHSEIQEVALQR